MLNRALRGAFARLALILAITFVASGFVVLNARAGHAAAHVVTRALAFLAVCGGGALGLAGCVAWMFPHRTREADQ